MCVLLSRIKIRLAASGVKRVKRDAGRKTQCKQARVVSADHSGSSDTTLGFFCRSVKYSARYFSICFILSINARS